MLEYKINDYCTAIIDTSRLLPYTHKDYWNYINMGMGHMPYTEEFISCIVKRHNLNKEQTQDVINQLKRNQKEYKYFSEDRWKTKIIYDYKEGFKKIPKYRNVCNYVNNKKDELYDGESLMWVGILKYSLVYGSIILLSSLVVSIFCGIMTNIN